VDKRNHFYVDVLYCTEHFIRRYVTHSETVKPGFHYPSWRLKLTARVDGWPISITRQHGPCRRACDSTSRVDGPSTRPVNSASGNRALTRGDDREPVSGCHHHCLLDEPTTFDEVVAIWRACQPAFSSEWRAKNDRDYLSHICSRFLVIIHYAYLSTIYS